MSTPPEVLAALEGLDLEVGDYHRGEIGVLVVGPDATQVRLEGWGEECVDGQGPAVALKACRTEARRWKNQFARTGCLKTTHPEVYGVTWGVKPAWPGDFDSEDTIGQGGPPGEWVERAPGVWTKVDGAAFLAVRRAPGGFVATLTHKRHGEGVELGLYPTARGAKVAASRWRSRAGA